MEHFLKEIEIFLNEAHNRFHSLKFKVGYGCFNTTYIVEVHPVDEFKHNEEFAKMEIDFCDSFEYNHPECTIIFVSDNSMCRVDKPILQIGYVYPVCHPMRYANSQYAYKPVYSSNSKDCTINLAA